MDPYVQTGTSLKINCTINSTDPSLTADKIYFEPNDRVSGATVKVIDSITAELEWPDMMRRESLGHVWCHVKDTELVDQTVVTVAGE